jgi:IS5 family transposase
MATKRTEQLSFAEALMGLAAVRYIGLAKVTAQVMMVAMASMPPRASPNA